MCTPGEHCQIESPAFGQLQVPDMLSCTSGLRAADRCCPEQGFPPKPKTSPELEIPGVAPMEEASLARGMACRSHLSEDWPFCPEEQMPLLWGRT